MKKVKLRTKVIALSAFAVLSIAALGYSKTSLANQNIQTTDETILLNVEKVDKDTVTVSLDNFKDIAKSLQLSLKIEGDVGFKADSINWLTKAEGESGIKTDIKLSSDKKNLDIFIVSNSNIVKDGGKMDLFEIDVEKKGSNSTYKIVPNVSDDGIAYSYIVSNTNRQERGLDIVNPAEGTLSINNAPTLSLVNSPAIIDGNIVIAKDSDFNALSYVVANDDEEGELKNITVDGTVTTSVVGSYGITYSVQDGEGEKATLSTTVMVEEVNEEEEVAPPVIEGVREEVTIKVGEDFDPLEGVTAKDWMGWTINVEYSGDYDVEEPGDYIIKYNAEDRRGNKAEEKTTKLIVVEAEEETPEVPEEKPEVPGNPGETPEVPEEKPEVPGNPDENPDSEVEIPSEIESIIDTNIVDAKYGNGEENSPLGLYVKDVTSDDLNKLLADFAKLNPVVQSKNVGEEYTSYKIKLTPKARLFRSSNDIYVVLNIKNASNELIALADNFAKSYGLVEGTTPDTDDTNNGGSVDGDNSNNNNSGSVDNNTTENNNGNNTIGESIKTGDKRMIGTIAVFLFSGAVLGVYFFKRKKA